MEPNVQEHQATQDHNQQVSNQSSNQIPKKPNDVKNPKRNKLTVASAILLLVAFVYFFIDYYLQLKIPGFITIFFYLAPIISFLLAIAALNQIRKTKEKGKILSIVIIIIVMVPVIFIAALGQIAILVTDF